MRDIYNKQLQLLCSEVKEMGEICISAIESSSKAVLNPPDNEDEFNNLCLQVKNYEEEIDHKERSIEGLCVRLMLHQQPVAGDLRTVTSAHRLISDMERIGDQALDIVELAKFIRNCGIDSKLHLNNLFIEVISMVKLVLSAFTERELQTAYKVINFDDKVDELFVKVKTELIDVIRKGGEGELALDILMVAKYLERIGDHAVNIANWIVYSITGNH
ncbi:MAG: phosphate signaling complex protein PhoU [Ruminococcus sp.]